MILKVSIEDFPATVRRIIGVDDVYVAAHGTGSVATASAPGKDVIVTALSPKDPELVTADLKKEKLEVHAGMWTQDGDDPEQTTRQIDVYIGAISYHTNQATPGLWVDAFPIEPTYPVVLKAMYDEFVANSEIQDIGLDEFVKIAKPNIVIVTPGEIELYLDRKKPCD